MHICEDLQKDVAIAQTNGIPKYAIGSVNPPIKTNVPAASPSGIDGTDMY